MSDDSHIFQQFSILAAIDAHQQDCGCPIWLPRLAQVTGIPEQTVCTIVEGLVADGMLRWCKAGIWGYTDVERVPALVGTS